MTNRGFAGHLQHVLNQPAQAADGQSRINKMALYDRDVGQLWFMVSQAECLNVSQKDFGYAIPTAMPQGYTVI